MYVKTTLLRKTLTLRSFLSSSSRHLQHLLITRSKLLHASAFKFPFCLPLLHANVSTCTRWKIEVAQNKKFCHDGIPLHSMFQILFTGTRQSFRSLQCFSGSTTRFAENDDSMKKSLSLARAKRHASNCLRKIKHDLTLEMGSKTMDSLLSPCKHEIGIKCAIGPLIKNRN